MLNTKKLLYLLPDVAYVAELLPAKKEHTFTVQSFRQINGEFMDDNAFIAENVIKLFSKLEQEEYFLVLPDFLFTNTIINIEETSDAKIKDMLTTKQLPDLGLKPETHQIETFVLTEFKGSSKVQLSAIEKEVLGPIRAAADNAKAKIEGTAPLSWTVKSIISLEPSISVLQIGTQLYTSEHYIGIDQTTITDVSDTESVAETIKTLRGAEPSIQTVYLLANTVVEETLKNELSDIIPIQQLASDKEEDSKMPSYVKLIIEAGMKTLSIEDYPVPIFKIEAASEEENAAFITEKVEELEIEESDDDLDEAGATLPLPTQATAAQLAADEALKAEEETAEVEDETDLAGDEADADVTAPITPLPGAVETVTKTIEPVEAVEATEEPESEPDMKDAPEIEEKTEEVEETKPEKEVKPAPAVITPEVTEKPAAEETPEEIDLSQFAQGGQTKAEAPSKSEPETKKAVIKNSSGIGNMLKMVFITLAVFAATVAIGIGVGLGVLSVANRGATSEPTDTSEMVSTPEPTPSPISGEDASPSADLAEINNEDFDILVVNATTRAGYAGVVKADLDEAGFGTVGASNASGEYGDGIFVLMSEANPALIAALEEATGLTITYLEEADPEDEDSAGSYDAVVVLAE